MRQFFSSFIDGKEEGTREEKKRELKKKKNIYEKMWKFCQQLENEEAINRRGRNLNELRVMMISSVNKSLWYGWHDNFSFSII